MGVQTYRSRRLNKVDLGRPCERQRAGALGRLNEAPGPVD